MFGEPIDMLGLGEERSLRDRVNKVFRQDPVESLRVAGMQPFVLESEKFFLIAVGVATRVRRRGKCDPVNCGGR